jgi:hypothetical protein
MTRAGWIAIALLVGASAFFRHKERDELEATTARLERERQQLAKQVAALTEQVAALKEEDATSDDEDEAPTVESSSVRDEENLERAQDAYVHGQYRLAIAAASIDVDVNPTRAWRIIGASRCYEKDQAGALRAYSHLDGVGRNFLKYVCSRNAITLP